MKSILSITILFSLLSSVLYGRNLINLNTQEQEYLKTHKIIKVHNEINYPPYNFNKNGKAMGLSIDYMNLLAKKLDIKIQYISGYEWNEFMDMLSNGKLDAMLNIRRTPSRAKIFSFTEPYAATAKSIFTNDNSIFDLDDLKEKIVCVPNGFYIEHYLESYYSDIKLINRQSILECIHSVLDGSSIATAGSRSIVGYLMQEENLTIKHEYIIPDKRLTVGLAIATIKDSLLRDILQKAMYTVSDEELRTISARWLGEKEKSIKTKKFYTLKPFKNTRVVTMCNNPNWAPIEFVDKNDNNVKGISIDTLRLLENKLNIEFKTVPTKSWSQSQKYLKEGKCEILPAAIETDKRKEYANFTVPYLVYRLAVITQNDKPFIESIDDIVDRSISRKKGSGLINKLKSIYPHINIVETSGYRESLKMVADGKVYCTIATLPVASYFIHNFQLDNLYVAGYLDQKYRLSIAVNKKDKELLQILEAGLWSISQQEHREISNKWLGAEDKLVETYDYTYFLYILSIVALILAILIYRQRILKSVNINLKQEMQDKVLENLKYKKQVYIDDLTKIYNRVMLEERLDVEAQKSLRDNLELSMVVMDIDYFKSINDTYGHLVGDKVLVELSKLISGRIRKDDLFVRWGGEEFVLLLPNTDDKEAKAIAEDLRVLIEEHIFANDIYITCSFGIASMQEDDKSSLFRKADLALYQAKVQGRNRVIIHQ